MTVDWTVWKPRLAYGAFFVVAFLVALRQTLPAEAIKDRLVLEAGQRGWLLDAADAGPAGLVGLGLKEVTLKDRDGLTVPIDALDVSLAPWSLLRGRLRLAVRARLYDGTVKGTFDLNGAPQLLDVAVDKVDLGRVIPLRRASGVDLDGVASGSASLTLPADPKVQPSGRAELVVTGAGLAGGKVAVPGMTGGLTLPKLSLGQLGVNVALEGGKATFVKLGTSGGDATLVADGLTLGLPPGGKLEYAPIFGQLSVKLSDAFAARPEGKTLKSLADLALAPGKGSDGAYHVQLFGSVGHPQARAAPPRP